MKKWIAWIISLSCILSFVGCKALSVSEVEASSDSTSNVQNATTSSVSQIKLFPDSMSIVPGVSVQLTVEGYTEDGELVTEEEIDKLNLCWEYIVDDHSFTVDEHGYLTALSAGEGVVWVRSEDGELNSHAIDVFVKE